MSRRRRNKSGHQLALVEKIPQASASVGGYGIGGGMMANGYQAAEWSSDLRGYVYWPSLEPRDEISSFTRLEIARKVHWLCANNGLPRRILDALTNLIVGTGLRPQGLTRDTAWNELAEASYNRRARSPLGYSVNGRQTAVQAQRMMLRTRLKDGDAAVVFSKSEAGRAMRAFYSGVQIGNASTRLDQDKWTDGVMLDRLQRIQAFRFPQRDGKWVDIPARDVCFLSRLEAPGQVRNVSILAHAVNKMIDIVEMRTSTVQNIKALGSVGYYITAGDGTKPSTMQDRLNPSGTQKLTTANGEITLKQVYNTGGEILALPKGAELKKLLDERPHPNQREFQDELIRDCAWGAGLSFELLWNIVKLGGANVRYILADAQTYVQTEQQDLVDTWLARDWAYHCAIEMQLGNLPPCQDPEWWKHGWVTPERQTVDFGRDGAIMLRMHAAGLLTTERWFGMRGQDAREETAKELDFVVWRKEEMRKRGLTPQDLQLYNANVAAATMAALDDAPEEIPDSPEDEEEIENPEEL